MFDISDLRDNLMAFHNKNFKILRFKIQPILTLILKVLYKTNELMFDKIRE